LSEKEKPGNDLQVHVQGEGGDFFLPLQMHYCVAVQTMPEGSLHRMYHDHQYGFPIENDNELFGRLLLEINQAGLSWITILKKQNNFRKAYAEFDVASIAAFGPEETGRLMADAGIIRNRLKIEAAIFNAQKVLQLQQQHGSFFRWLNEHHPQSKSGWTKLFRKTFRFTGGEIVGEFLMSTGFLPGAHLPECPVFEKTRQAGASCFVSP
jgi:DNA-3-methyladenine glycosylase I